ncbi:STAS domain-containing protein [Micromonospora sp. H33]|uniref:STAS domain-containing protein n=1 Tax=Micromonospora sp. H33 TaxID=3452215 RepID=UPI003F89B4B1
MASEGPTRSISVSGEIDMSNAHLLVDMVELVAAPPAPWVALDLSEVTFFSAHGISALLRAHHLVTCAGGVLTLPAVSPVVRYILGVTGVHHVFGVHPPSARREIIAHRSRLSGRPATLVHLPAPNRGGDRTGPSRYA